MIQEKKPSVNGLAREPLDVDYLLQLIDQQAYDRLTRLLVEAESVIKTGDSASNYVDWLHIMRHLALSCYVFEKSAHWHHQASEQARIQTAESVKVLRDFLQSAKDSQWGTHAHSTLSSARIAELRDETNRSLWERIKRVFQSQPPSPAPIDSPLPPAQIFDDIANMQFDTGNGAHDEPVTPVINEEIPPNNDTASHGHSSHADTMSNGRYPAAESAGAQDSSPAEETNATLLIYGLGVFCAYYDGTLITEWGTRKSKSIFKYLLLNRHKPIPKELLMDVFWRDSDETSARNNLNVTIYNLRRALRDVDDSQSYILYQDDCYYLNPDLHIWFDYDVFTVHYKRGCTLQQAGNQSAAMHEFQQAELIYGNALFEEDRYDDWLLPQRETAHTQYLQVIKALAQFAFDGGRYMDCINLCRKLLTLDACAEHTHRLLMQSYAQQGQTHLAIRQYYKCVDALAEELDVSPAEETVQLYEQIATR